VDERTDLQVNYNYYRADNYVNNFIWSQPYGTSMEEHGVTATISRQMTKALRASLKYGYFRNRDTTSGGHSDYDAHLLYASLQHRF
jgi:predicted porin